VALKHFSHLSRSGTIASAETTSKTLLEFARPLYSRGVGRDENALIGSILPIPF
jgi:hypothetical protein